MTTRRANIETMVAEVAAHGLVTDIVESIAPPRLAKIARRPGA